MWPQRSTASRSRTLNLRTVASSLPALPADVVIDDAGFQDGQALGRFDVEHSTFHVEAGQPRQAR